MILRIYSLYFNILRLSLIDPDSYGFAAAACRLSMVLGLVFVIVFLLIQRFLMNGKRS